MANRQAQLIIVLGAVLLAVLAASGAVLWLLQPAAEDGLPGDTLLGTPSPLTTERTTAGAAGFDTAVLRSSRYTTLDQQLVNDGSLPVAPPAATGKANPFL